MAHRVAPSVAIDLTLAVDTIHGLAEAAATWVEQPHAGWHVVIAATPEMHPPITDVLTGATDRASSD